MWNQGLVAIQTEMSMVLPAVFPVRTTEGAAIWSSTLQQVTVGEMKNVDCRVGLRSYEVNVFYHLWEKTEDINYYLNIKGEERRHGPSVPTGSSAKYCAPVKGTLWFLPLAPAVVFALNLLCGCLLSNQQFETDLSPLVLSLWADSGWWKDHAGLKDNV